MTHDSLVAIHNLCGGYSNAALATETSLIPLLSKPKTTPLLICRQGMIFLEGYVAFVVRILA